MTGAWRHKNSRESKVPLESGILVDFRNPENLVRRVTTINRLNIFGGARHLK